MKLLVLADIDEFHWQWETGAADVILSCGDVADSLILEATEAYHCTCVYAVKGNHDTSTPFPRPVVDLHFNVEQNGGVMLGGFNGCWKYKPRGHFLYEQTEVTRMLSHFPRVDVFVAHNAPREIHDKDDDVHIGFDAFRQYIQRTQPALFVHGHQHVNQETVVGKTRVIGAYGHVLLNLLHKS